MRRPGADGLRRRREVGAQAPGLLTYFCGVTAWGGRTLPYVSPESASDASLWADARRGHGDSFGMLFDRHRDRLFHAALRDLGDPDDAEDAVAASFLELWRRRDAARIVDGSLLPWLLVTVHNVSRNLTRHRRRYRSFIRRLPVPETVRSTEEATIEAADRFEHARQARELLARLAPADAQILTLVAIEELPLDQVASALGISVDAAKQRLSRARRRGRDLTQTVPIAPEGGTR